MLFADLLSLHLVTFFMFFILVYGQLTQVLTTLAVLVEECTDPGICSNTESTFLWKDDKASSPFLKTGGTQRSRHSKSMDNTSLIHSFILIIYMDRDLPQSIQVPCSIDNTMHAPVHHSQAPIHATTVFLIHASEPCNVL